SVVETVKFTNSKFFGLFVNNGWLGTYNNIRTDNSTGMGVAFLRNNSSYIEQLIMANHDSAINMPDLKSYSVDGTSEGGFASTFWPLETVSTTGDKTAVFLGWANRPHGSSMVFAHVSGGDFINDETLTGAASTHTADINLTSVHKHDLRSGLYTEGTAAHFVNFVPEDLLYTDDTAGYNYPLVLIHGDGTVFNSIRAETGSANFKRKMANVWFHVQECDNVSINNFLSFSVKSTYFVMRNSDSVNES
ncbi:hypothetical protein LCGC14_3087130, partial [marine sediment metagenome]